MWHEDGIKELFDDIALNYDRWYDTPEGSAILAEELACLRTVVPEFVGDWLEVGVGTGRFAAALGVQQGLDPSPPMLALATGRGIRTQTGVAEALPYADCSFHGLLMVASLCFVADTERALAECARVLRPGGMLLIGHIPSDGPWGREYVLKAKEGHPVYSLARFTTVAETVGIVAAAGFYLDAAASALFWSPGSAPPASPRIEHGTVSGAGFVALGMRLATG